MVSDVRAQVYHEARAPQPPSHCFNCRLLSFTHQAITCCRYLGSFIVSVVLLPPRWDFRALAPRLAHHRSSGALGALGLVLALECILGIGILALAFFTTLYEV